MILHETRTIGEFDQRCRMENSRPQQSAEQDVNIAIFPASPEDAVEILTLQKLAYQSEAQLNDDWSIPPLTQTLSGIRAEFETKVFLKAVRADRIIGSVRASLSSGTCAIGRLIVHPDYQGKGIGTRLMEKIETVFCHAKRFELFTGKKSLRNIRFYRRLGYRECREEDLSPKVRLVFMEKWITNGGP
jgi:ribosomal protein S18 acetylase RimI-like enzyme